MRELSSALGIQWSALIAQMVNFAILLFILRRFVYKPVLRIIDQRREMVARSVRNTEEIARHKEIVDRERALILRKADGEAGALMERAKTEAETLRTEVEKSARAQAGQIVAKGIEQMENDRAAMVKEIQNKLAHAIVLSAEKILRREFSREDQESFENELKENLPSLLS